MKRRTIRLHDMSSRDVIARAQSTKVGVVNDLLFSPDDGHLGAVVVETASGIGGLLRRRHWVLGSNVVAIGSDALIIPDGASLLDDDDSIDRTGLVGAADLKGRPVITDAGERIGKIIDFELSPDEGRLVNYVIDLGRSGGGLGLSAGQDHPATERVVPIQPSVVVGPEIVTIPVALLSDSPPSDTASRDFADEGQLGRREPGSGAGSSFASEPPLADRGGPGREEP